MFIWDKHVRGSAHSRTRFRSSASGSAPSRRAERLPRQIAERKAAEAEPIAVTMWTVYADEIPAYNHITDPVLIEDVRSVSEALVRVWLDVMGSGQTPSLEALRDQRDTASAEAFFRQAIERSGWSRRRSSPTAPSLGLTQSLYAARMQERGTQP